MIQSGPYSITCNYHWTSAL